MNPNEAFEEWLTNRLNGEDTYYKWIDDSKWFGDDVKSMLGSRKKVKPADTVSSTVNVAIPAVFLKHPQDIFTPEECGKILGVKEQLLSQAPFLLDMSEKYVVAGGVFTSLFHQEDINDIDVFILDTGKLTPQELIPNYSKAWFSEVVSEYRANPNVISVYDDEVSELQYILTSYKTRKELLASFDFLHCCVSYHKQQLHINRAMYDAIAKKKLVPVGETQDARRFKKFVRQGFTE